MVDFLIQNQTHWAKKLSPVEYSKQILSAQQVNIESGWELDDIVEVFDDGRLGSDAHAVGKFRVLRVPEIKEKNKEFYHQSQERVFTEVITLKRRRFQVVLPSGYDGQLDIKLTKAQFLSYLKDKDAI